MKNINIIERIDTLNNLLAANTHNLAAYLKLVSDVKNLTDTNDIINNMKESHKLKSVECNTLKETVNVLDDIIHFYETIGMIDKVPDYKQVRFMSLAQIESNKTTINKLEHLLGDFDND